MTMKNCARSLLLLLFCCEAFSHLDVHPPYLHQTVDNQRHYTGYSVFRIIPTSEEELSVLRTLTRDEHKLDFWKPPTTVNQAVDVMVPPDRIAGLEQLLIDNRIARTILMHDVERYIRKEKFEMSAASKMTGRDSNTFFHSYRRLQEIYNFIDKLGKRNPNITTVFSIGKSFEGRDLKVIKIGSKSSKSSKPSIWIDGGIHAREWVSPSTVIYTASRLVEDYASNDVVKSLVDHFDWYILPVVNPDGYEYSHTANRMWRKSRRGPVLSCYGADLNRNFGFHWREGGSSSSPCSDTYAGSEAFSEPETQVISDYILRNKNFVAFLAIHSYSQLWLTPWGYTSALPDDYDQLVKVAKEATDAIAQYGTKYRIGSSTNVLYVASGGADDWAKGVAGIKYTYTVELRDTGRYGFMLPTNQILPTAEETWAGIKAMAKAIKRDT